MEIILKEMKKQAITLSILVVILFPIGILCGVNWLTMLLSVLFGSLFTLANFMLLGSICDKACRKSPEKARTYMQFNYTLRILLVGIVILASLKLSYLSPLGVIPPLFAPKITYFMVAIYQTIFQKKS